MSEQLTPAQQEMSDLFEIHMNAEMDGDLDTTMGTMTDNPHLLNIANGLGGAGKEGVREFYETRLVGKFFPPDVNFTQISRTMDDSRMVDELIISFTHSTRMEWMFPGIEPTGKYVKVPLVVIAGFEDGKISYEHIYWDQAGALVQIGLLDPSGLPVSGAQSAEFLLRNALK